MKKLVAVCMALVMALGLAACGGSGSSSSAPAASSGAVSAPAASGTSASEADDGIAMTGGNVEEHSVEAIKAKGVLVVTTEAGYAPFEFLDENDNVVGLDASLAQALADDRSTAPTSARRSPRIWRPLSISAPRCGRRTAIRWW